MISLVVRNGNKLKSIKALIDTGFTGFLTLPISLIRELNLSWKYRDRGTLGDGSETLFDVYEENVIWDGEYREIEIMDELLERITETIELCLEVEKEEFKPLEFIGVQRIAINK